MGTKEFAASRLTFKSALGVATLGAGLLATSAAQAATFTVTNTDDAGPGSLRDAVIQANNTAGADIINFDPTVFADPIANPVLLTGNELLITDSVALDGSGRDFGIVVDARDNSRVFNIANNATVTMNAISPTFGTAENGGCINVDNGATLNGTDLFIFNCLATAGGPGMGGAALFNAGTVQLVNSRVSGNFADFAGNSAGNGGGILNAPTGSLTMLGGSIENNRANRAGGGIENDGGTVVLTSVAVNDNTAVGGIAGAPGRGGAIHVSGAGMVTINGGSFNRNRAGQEGGGLWNSEGGTITVQLDGATGTALVDNDVTLVAPVAGDVTRGGGSIFNLGTMTVTGASISDSDANGPGANGGGIMNRGADADLTVTDTAISNNTAARAGGAVENQGGASVTLTNVIFEGNSADVNGGAVHAAGTDTSTTVQGGLFTDNEAASEGGGLWAAGTSLIEPDADGEGTIFDSNSANGLAGDQGGGALFNEGGMMTVMGARLFGNSAIAEGPMDDNGDPTGSGSGGGILNNVVNGVATLMVSDTIFGLNDANRAGGGIEDNGGTVILINVTMEENAAGVFGTAATPGNGGCIHSGGGTVTITGGSYSLCAAGREGGGIWTSGMAQFTDITVTDSEAFGPESNHGGGGLFNQGGNMTVTNSTIEFNVASGTAGSGGGILNNGGTLTVMGGSISNNTSNRAGGGIEDNGRDTATTVTLTGVTMNLNQTGSAPGNGGAVHISGTGNMTISGSMFDGNIATAEGGALWNSSGDSVMTVNSSTITSNVASGVAADQGGGGLFNDGGTLTVNGSTIFSNRANGAAGSGGGILNDGGTLVVNDSTINSNTSQRAGGAIEDDATGGNPTTTTLTRVTMDDNETGGSPGNGGATHVTGPGTITIDSSTVSNNTADNEGGGVWNHNSSTMNITNSTISGNTSPLGGGVFTQNGAAATVNITNATIASNSSRGIEAAGSDAVVNLTNTIVADNTGGDISATVNANFSLIESTSGAVINGGNNITGQDPQLGALTDNGGPTLTQLVTSGPAIDGGSNAGCSSVDQRNVGRPLDGNADGVADCDIGAVEFADGPVAAVAVAGGVEEVQANLGDEDVPALSITYNNSSDEGIMVSTIEGRVNGGRLTNVSELTLLRNGVQIPANISFSRATGAFVADLVNAEPVAANSSATFTVALSFDSANAAISLFALMLLGLTLLWRRSRTLVAMLLAGSLSIACSGSNSVSDQEDDQIYSVTVSRVVATGDNTMAPVASPALPVTGGNVRLILDD